MARPRIVAAMSGGVDSSMAVALLQQKGYDVIGVTMQMWEEASTEAYGERRGSCYFVNALADARLVAERLGIKHYVVNVSDEFQRKVVQYFCQEYASGRTPNPCTVCNSRLKFRYLLDEARALDANLIATGHYARLRYDANRDRFVLLAAIDKRKDQSYVLYGLTQEQLAHALFPLGRLTKEKTRTLAKQLGLTVAKKKDSQEICFVPDDDYRAFLDKRIPTSIKPGPFLDKHGQVLGTHRGLPFYTVGQRRHLGVASGSRLYVISMNPKRNSITLGEEKALWRHETRVEKVNWVSISAPTEPLEAMVRVRYRGIVYPARLCPKGTTAVHIRFHKPARAVAPGQAAVFYGADDEVLGGGIISD
jgi:tRNA-specific 2-thiouridylase